MQHSKSRPFYGVLNIIALYFSRSYATLASHSARAFKTIWLKQQIRAQLSVWLLCGYVQSFLWTQFLECGKHAWAQWVRVYIIPVLDCGKPIQFWATGTLPLLKSKRFKFWEMWGEKTVHPEAAQSSVHFFLSTLQLLQHSRVVAPQATVQAHT